jgi:hypothetical protein
VSAVSLDQARARNRQADAAVDAARAAVLDADTPKNRSALDEAIRARQTTFEVLQAAERRERDAAAKAEAEAHAADLARLAEIKRHHSRQGFGEAIAPDVQAIVDLVMGPMRARFERILTRHREACVAHVEARDIIRRRGLTDFEGPGQLAHQAGQAQVANAVREAIQAAGLRDRFNPYEWIR